ncbi:PQ-loop repeat-containing protein 3 [Lingula anatina]|uniref:Solute carrier family 66 member 3 n=1 Tax=Lingula anatina TaxID=7574 RepID=A0A1S3J1C8_LINAN|nr:PQ-loop repeat-containing protein 3 [Lingula anatina]|eukprot:XP_013404252.1 PQ-loop repeat-containing protein 3 [Lingula anatina]
MAPVVSDGFLGALERYPYVALLCHALSSSVVGFCLILKLPQILSVIKAGNSKGLSLRSIALELASYTTMLTYQFAHRYPVENYFEYTFLVVQDLLLLYTVLSQEDKLNSTAFLGLGIYLSIFSTFAFGVWPSWLMAVAMGSVIPISLTSKVLQLWNIYQTKDSGQVSLATWVIASYACFARVFTTLVKTRDVIVLTNLAINAVLNSNLVLCIWYFRPYANSDKKRKD